MITVINIKKGDKYLFCDETGWRDSLVSAAMMEARIGVSNPDQRPKFDAKVKLSRFGATISGLWVKRT